LDKSFYFEGTRYWSQGDEQAHFGWLGRISAIRGVRGEGRRVYLDVDLLSVTNDDVRELEAIYRRYGGDLSQLNELKASVNAED
jgi:hypothetical protein